MHPSSSLGGRTIVAETATCSWTQLVTGLDCRSSCGEFDSRQGRHFQPEEFSRSFPMCSVARQHTSFGTRGPQVQILSTNHGPGARWDGRPLITVT